MTRRPAPGRDVLASIRNISLDNPATRWRLALISVPIAVVIGIGIFFFLGGFGIFGRDTKDDGIEFIDRSLPTTSSPDAMMQRLNALPGNWEATKLDAPKRTALTGVTADLSKSKAVITNTTNVTSVTNHGALLLVWTGHAPDTLELLRRTPRPFSGSLVSGPVQRYQLGTWAAFYAPGDGTSDNTDQVKEYLTTVSWCPYNTKPCPEAFNKRE